SERDPECALARSGAFHLHLLCIFAYADEDFWERDVFLRIEILRQLLIAEHLVADQNALARINSTKPAAHQRSPAHRDVLATVVFQENQIVIPKGHEPICFGEILEDNVSLA